MRRTVLSKSKGWDYGKCPKCGVSWDGGVVNGMHLSRVLSLEDPVVYDGISWFRCPDCGTTWDRWTHEEWRPGDGQGSKKARKGA